MPDRRKTLDKKLLAAYVAKELPKTGFVTSNGWAQVDGKGEQANRDYGRWEALMELATEFDLELP